MMGKKKVKTKRLNDLEIERLNDVEEEIQYREA